MKFGQLIEYNMKNIFIEKSYTRCGWETSPQTLFWKIEIEHLWINSLKFYTDYFYRILGWGLLKYIETKLQTTCFYLISSIFKN